MGILAILAYFVFLLIVFIKCKKNETHADALEDFLCEKSIVDDFRL